MVNKLKKRTALYGTPTSELWGVTCHLRSHSATCYPTQVNTPHLTPACRRVLDLPPQEGWKAELT